MTILFRILFIAMILSAGMASARAEDTGHRMGSFLLKPSIRVMENFDSNIYATNSGTKSDFITAVSPKLEVKSTNENRGANFYAFSEHGFYRHHSDENYNDLQAELSPYWVISRALKLNGKLLFEKKHEAREAESGLNTPLAEEPTQWKRSIGRLGWEYKRGRVGMSMFGELSHITYDNVDRVGGGQEFVNDDRDRNESQFGGEIACDITDRSAVYWATRWFGRDYKRSEFVTGPNTYTGDNRDSDGIETLIGLRMPMTHLISLDANVGYYRQSFDDTSFETVNTGVGSLKFTWAPTALTKVGLDLARAVYETTQSGASTYVAHEVGVRIDHELRRNIVADAGIRFAQHDYQDFDRDDDVMATGAGLTYKFGRNLNLGTRLSYLYEDRDSDAGGLDYDKHRVLLSLEVPF